MVSIFALIYVLAAVISIGISIFEAYQERLAWGDFLIMLGISLVPLMNVIFIGVCIGEFVKDSKILKKRVFPNA